METLVANVQGKAVRRTLYGREYLVAPATLIVPGVLNGSEGPLYYPPEEIGRYPDSWNHKPITLNHPAVGGSNDPDILNRSYLGFLLNTRVENGRLIADAWFDLPRVMQVDRRILNNLLSGIPIELSTGLNLDKEAVQNGLDPAGKPYGAIARNYRPDHLAILLDGKGACSLNDGCGVLNDTDTKTENKSVIDLSDEDRQVLSSLMPKEKPMARPELVTTLIQNCSCWSEGDRETLNNMPDEKVQAMVDAAKKAKNDEAVANAAKRGFEGKEGSYVYNSATNQMEFKAKEPTPNPTPTPDPTPSPNPNTTPKPGVTNEDIKSALKSMTPEEWFEIAPPVVQDQAREYNRVTNEEKGRLVEAWVGNAAEDKKEEAKKWAEGQTIETLRTVVNSLPKRSSDNPYSDNYHQQNRPDYSGQSPAYHVENEKKPEPLGLPEWDFQMAK